MITHLTIIRIIDGDLYRKLATKDLVKATLWYIGMYGLWGVWACVCVWWVFEMGLSLNSIKSYGESML